MSSLNFPESPSPGQVFDNWEWDGIKWSGVNSITFPIPIERGGTSATTAPEALANLGGMPITGGTFTGSVGISPGGLVVSDDIVAAGNVYADSGGLFFGSGGAWSSVTAAAGVCNISATGSIGLIGPTTVVGNAGIGGSLSVDVNLDVAGNIGCNGSLGTNSGRVSSINSNNQPSFNMWDTGAGVAGGMYSEVGSGRISFGQMDASGNPIAGLAFLDRSGNFAATGNVNANGAIGAGGDISTGANVIGNGAVMSSGVYFQNNGGWFYTPNPVWSSGLNTGGIQSGDISCGNVNASGNVSAAAAIFFGGMYWQNNGGVALCPWPVTTQGNLGTNGSLFSDFDVNAGRNVNGGQGNFGGAWTNCGNPGIQYAGLAPNFVAFQWAGGSLYAFVDGGNQGWITFNGCDARFKRDFEPIRRDCLATINKIALEQFDWPHDPTQEAIDQNDDLSWNYTEPHTDVTHWEVGYTAQQIQEIMPEAVTEAPMGGGLGVDLRMLVSHLIGAVQQLSKRVEELEAA